MRIKDYGKWFVYDKAKSAVTRPPPGVCGKCEADAVWEKMRKNSIIMNEMREHGMKFEEALEHIRGGCKMRAVSWRDHFYTQKDWVDDESFVFSIRLEDINGDWEHFVEKEPAEIKIVPVDEDMCVLKAMDYLTMGYKVTRLEWDDEFYIQNEVMYQHGEPYKKEYSIMFDIDDVKALDWIAYK